MIQLFSIILIVPLKIFFILTVFKHNSLEIFNKGISVSTDNT